MAAGGGSGVRVVGGGSWLLLAVLLLQLSPWRKSIIDIVLTGHLIQSKNLKYFVEL